MRYIKPVCPNCGGSSIETTALVLWNEQESEWEIDEVAPYTNDKFHCIDCENDFEPPSQLMEE